MCKGKKVLEYKSTYQIIHFLSCEGCLKLVLTNFDKKKNENKPITLALGILKATRLLFSISGDNNPNIQRARKRVKI